MVDLSSEQSLRASNSERMPPLENGDCLTSHEFARRYEADTRIKKAELIEGVVYVASPLRFESHAEPHGRLITWLGVYQAFTPTVRLGIEPTIRLDEDNQPQPDGVLLLPASMGGTARLTEDDYVEGSPDFVAEVAASSVAIDMNAKLNAYRRNGVKEYLVWQIFGHQIVWFSLQQGTYVPLAPDANGVVKSQVFPGLWLAVVSLLQGEMSQVLNVLQAGVSSPEHAAFVQQ
ncbi:MAG: Uma2 family endonuclease [Leptolyngbyaceae cyanobacterium bins.302]|nr:Uma2 family endonuclease [Leptolyngbyaceae cyanobacterium bins.302]